MATGALDTNGIWQYGEDDSEATFSALLNKLAASTSTEIGDLNLPGRVVQIAYGSSTTSKSTSSTSYVTTNLQGTITPKFSNSRIFIIAHQLCNNSTANTTGTWTLFRDSTSGTNLGNGASGITDIYNSAGSTSVGVTQLARDTPGTTSAVTYYSAMRVSFGSTTITSQQSSARAVMFLIEVTV